MTVPAPVMVTVLPEIVAGPEAIEKLTANPDEDEALTAKAASRGIPASKPLITIPKTLMAASRPLSVRINRWTSSSVKDGQTRNSMARTVLPCDGRDH